MEKVIMATGFLNVIIAVLGVFVMATLVIKTEKGLDAASKAFMLSAVILFLATLFEINKYFNIVSHDFSMTVFQISRTLALIFFVSGGYILLRVIEKEIKK